MFQPQKVHAAYSLTRLQEATYACSYCGQDQGNGPTRSQVNGSNKFLCSLPTPMSTTPITTTGGEQGVNTSKHSEKGLLHLPPNAKRSKPLEPFKGSTSTSVKLWTGKDFEERQAKGLCFWCDEKNSYGHKCSKKQIYVVEVDDEEQMEGGEKVDSGNK